MARRTKEDAQATRDALLDAAERVFERRGVTRASLAEIAADAGLTRGAVYWHFRDKADVFAAMLARAVQPLEDHMARLDAPAPGDADPVETLLQAIDAALQQMASDAHIRRVLVIANFMVEHADDQAPLRTALVEKHRRGAQRIATALERSAQRRGLHPILPAAPLGHAAHALIVGLVQSWLLDQPFDLPATCNAALRALLVGAGFDSTRADQG